MKKYKRVLAVITLYIYLNLSVGTIFAQNQPNFKTLNIDNGLSQSTAEAIFQDSNGYIWIGTNDGLNRYNGVDVKIFKSTLDNTNLASSYILSINEDNSKRLWVGTDAGISIIDLSDYSIKNYKYFFDENGNKGELLNVHTILKTTSGHMLVGTYNGVHILNEENNRFERVINSQKYLTNTNVQNMTQDKDGNIWICTDDGINKIDILSKKIYKYPSTDEISLKMTNTITFDTDNNIWVSTYENGVYILNPKTNEFTNYKHDEDNKYSIPSNTTKSILQDKNGTIWIATEEGLSKYIGSDKFITYKNKSYDPTSIASDIVYTIMEDKSGLLWVGTYTGVSIFDPYSEIISFKNDPMDNNTLSSNVIHGIYEDEDSQLWVGTRDKGINIIDKNNNIKHLYAGTGENNLSSNAIRTITGKDNIIWVGTRNGINKINKDTMTIKKYTTEDGLSNNNIKSLLIDSNGYLWIGTPNTLEILNPETDEILNLTSKLKDAGIMEPYIEDIKQDKNGIYWLGERITGALIEIDPYKESITVYNNKTIDTNSPEYAINTIKCIELDDNNNLWIGTNNGVVYFNPSTKDYKVYTEEDGLINNNTYGIVLDNDGNPWISTNNGLSKLDLKSSKFRNFTVENGLNSNEFNGKAYYIRKDGSLVFGGIKGISIINPSKISNSFYVPQVSFDSFDIIGTNYINIDNMKFKYNENHIRIKYFLPDYKMEDYIQYYYKLDGVNNDWIITRSNEAIFSDLEPGSYTFRVKARTLNGDISEENTVNFQINPPIWKSFYAKIFYIITILILIYYQVTKVKRLDKLVEKRTNELQKEMRKNRILFEQLIDAEKTKNNYFINLSHELRTPLNVLNSIEQLISSYNQSGKKLTDDKLKYYMKVMRNNTNRLFNLINNIIDTSKIENGKYKINLKEHNIVYVVEEATLTLKNMIESKGINLIIDTDIEEKIIRCDAYEIERCIVNLVSNASKFTKKGGNIIVTIEDLGKETKIYVEDNGIGIDEKYHKTIFNRFNQVIDEQSESKGGSGLGLTITKHLIDLHGGNIYVESKINVGTKFTIILPDNI